MRQGLSEFTINGRRIRVDDASETNDKTRKKEDRVFDKWEKKGGKSGGKKRY